MWRVCKAGADLIGPFPLPTLSTLLLSLPTPPSSAPLSPINPLLSRLKSFPHSSSPYLPCHRDRLERGTVTDWNVEYLARLVENGADVLPGATHVEDERGQLVSLAHLNPDRRRALARTLLSTPSAAALAANQRATGVHVKDGEGKKGGREGAAVEGEGGACAARDGEVGVSAHEGWRCGAGEPTGD
ncbi:unnamed protein product [Closterium sp. NIES-64]|nr:unnamed protein product [Closterium sp. NIES-64]